MIKKKVSTALAICLAFGCVTALPNVFDIDINAIGVRAYDESEKDPYEIVHSGNYDYRYANSYGYVIVKYTGKETDVTLPESIDGNNISYVDVNAFDGCTWLKSITIPKSVQFRSIIVDDYGIITSQYISKTPFVTPAKGLKIYCYGASNNGVVLSNPNNDKGDYKAIYADTGNYNGFEYYLRKDNKAIIYEYNGHDENVIIPDKVNDIEVSGVLPTTFSDCTKIKSIYVTQNIRFTNTIQLYDFFLASSDEDYSWDTTSNYYIYTKSDNVLFKFSKDFKYLYEIIGVKSPETKAYLNYNLMFYDLNNIKDLPTNKITFGNDSESSTGRAENGCIYNGNEQIINVRNFYNGTVKLVEGTDYTVTYKDNVNAGTATQIITGKGNYTGTETHTFNIMPVSIENCSFDIPSTGFTYTGKEIKPKVTVKFNGSALKEGTDYTISYTNNINIGIATMDIKGKGNFTGTHSASFLIVKDDLPTAKTSIKSAKITGLSNKTYTGKALTQTPTVKLGSKTLKSGTDYTLSYKNNKAVGTATVTITGMGAYTGTVKATFKICPKKTTIKKVTSPKTKQLKVTYGKVSGVTGYQVTYSTSSKFTKKTTKSANAAGTSKTISKLTKGKTYYVKVRTYKTVGKTKYYSGYSAVKKIKVK